MSTRMSQITKDVFTGKRAYITTPKTICIQIAMHDKLKQYTFFCKDGFNMIKVYDLPSMKNGEASVEVAGSKNSS